MMVSSSDVRLMRSKADVPWRTCERVAGRAVGVGSRWSAFGIRGCLEVDRHEKAHGNIG